jgi:hypothetical protein
VSAVPVGAGLASISVVNTEKSLAAPPSGAVAISHLNGQRCVVAGAAQTREVRVLQAASFIAALDGEVRMPISAPAPLRAALLRAGLPVVMFPPHLLADAPPVDRAQKLLELPAEYGFRAGRQDLVIAELGLLVNANRFLAEARSEVRQRAAFVLSWRSPVADSVGRMYGQLADAFKGTDNAAHRMLHHMLTNELPDVYGALRPDDPMGHGVGPASVAALVSAVVHPARFQRVRDLHAYAGFMVRDGRAVRLATGHSVRWNARLRSTLLNLARTAWARLDPQTCHWRSLYESLVPECADRHQRTCQNPRCNPGAHTRAMAWRLVIKRFLAEAYLGWRLIEMRNGRWPRCGQQQ